jgi:hypothetical protein
MALVRTSFESNKRPWPKAKLQASGPTWRSPPPMESRLPHSHLDPSPRRFLVESHLLLGCSHKILNRTSSAFDLSRCSTTTTNTILGLCSQGLSRHVLPHAAPGFFAGRGRKGWWSSPNFASILLDPRDDILSSMLGRMHTKPGREYIMKRCHHGVLNGFGQPRVQATYL